MMGIAANMDVRAARDELAASNFEFIRISGGNRQERSGLGELPSHEQPQPSRSSGDNHCSTGKVEPSREPDESSDNCAGSDDPGGTNAI